MNVTPLLITPSQYKTHSSITTYLPGLKRYSQYVLDSLALLISALLVSALLTSASHAAVIDFENDYAGPETTFIGQGIEESYYGYRWGYIQTLPNGLAEWVFDDSYGDNNGWAFADANIPPYDNVGNASSSSYATNANASRTLLIDFTNDVDVNSIDIGLLAFSFEPVNVSFSAFYRDQVIKDYGPTVQLTQNFQTIDLGLQDVDYLAITLSTTAGIALDNLNIDGFHQVGEPGALISMGLALLGLLMNRQRQRPQT